MEIQELNKQIRNESTEKIKKLGIVASLENSNNIS